MSVIIPPTTTTPKAAVAPTLAAPNAANKDEKQTNHYKVFVQSEAVVKQMMAALGNADPARVQRIISLFLNAGIKSPDLYNATKTSIAKAMMDCAAYGIEPNGRDAYILPYKNYKLKIVEAQLIISYMGMVTLCHKSERIAKVEAEIVRKGDSFSWHNGEVDHTIDWFDEDRGPMVGVYATCTYKDGTKQSAILSTKQVEDIRARSRSKDNGPWVTDFEEMAKKTAVRRLSKLLPLSPDAAAAIAAEDDLVVDAPAVEPTTKTIARASAMNLLAAPTTAIEIPAAGQEPAVVASEATYDAIPLP